MKKLSFLLLFLPSVLFSQTHFEISSNGGYSLGFHKIDYQQTGLYPLYKTIEVILPDLTFEDFIRVYKIRNYVHNPVFGVDGEIYNEKIPIFISVGVSTSPSTLQKPRYKGEIGIRKDVTINGLWTIQGKGSFMYVIDRGFGTSTIINSVGNDVARNSLKNFFVSAPIKQNGYLIYFGGLIYRNFGDFSIGSEFYYNLDVTYQLKRYARMSALGGNVKITFHI